MRDPDAARAFVETPWASAARDKAAYWREWKRRNGPAASIQLADELRRQVIAARPDWPSEEERREDFEMHLRLIDIIRRVPIRPR
ncbi:MAG: hypothetical protein ABI193_21755 [Minicystis sp.]